MFKKKFNLKKNYFINEMYLKCKSLKMEVILIQLFYFVFNFLILFIQFKNKTDFFYNKLFKTKIEIILKVTKYLSVLQIRLFCIVFKLKIIAKNMLIDPSVRIRIYPKRKQFYQVRKSLFIWKFKRLLNRTYSKAVTLVRDRKRRKVDATTRE